MYFSKNSKNITLSNKLVPLHKTNQFMAQLIYPLIIIPKGDTIKCVLDARHLNSNTEQSDESWPIEPLAPQLARANKKYKSAIDLMYAYAHTPLDEDTIKVTSFSSGDKLFAFIRGFYGLKGLPNFFTKRMSTFFKTLIEQGFDLVYIDDILHLSDSKEHMFQLIDQLHIISTQNNLKLPPEKSFFMLLKVKFLGMKLVTIQLNHFIRKFVLQLAKLP